jgi:hypothetical protein
MPKAECSPRLRAGRRKTADDGDRGAETQSVDRFAATESTLMVDTLGQRLRLLGALAKDRIEARSLRRRRPTALARCDRRTIARRCCGTGSPVGSVALALAGTAAEATKPQQKATAREKFCIVFKGGSQRNGSVARNSFSAECVCAGAERSSDDWYRSPDKA